MSLVLGARTGVCMSGVRYITTHISNTHTQSHLYSHSHESGLFFLEFGQQHLQFERRAGRRVWCWRILLQVPVCVVVGVCCMYYDMLCVV